jgi:nitrogen-specific signal transduction histidine kinase
VIRIAAIARLDETRGRARIMEEENKIPLELVKQLRVLAHDLSNALETIVQATYLLSQANPPETTRRWVHLIDQSSQDAVRLNQKLREILRSQTL